jgi:hypothetical protein
MTHSDVADCIHQEPGAPCKCGLWKLQDDEYKLTRDLAAAQARERELRSALAKVDDIACRTVGGSHYEDLPESANRDGEELANLSRTALFAPQDATALRALLLKVARAAMKEAWEWSKDSTPPSYERVVDAVLKGDK